MSNGDFEGAKKSPVIARGPFLEMDVEGYNGLDMAEKVARPRQLKHIFIMKSSSVHLTKLQNQK